MPPSGSDTALSPVKILSSSEILGEGSEVQIEHKGMIYRLRVTRQDKLILTK